MAKRLAPLFAQLDELEARGKTWYKHKLTWHHYKIPKALGPFPFPIELVPRVLFWSHIFARHPFDSAIIYDKRDFFVLGHKRVPGAGLTPGDPGVVRRHKTSLRAVAAKPVMASMRTGIRALAAREARAARKERRYWWKWRKQCRLVVGRKAKRRCYKLLRIHPRLYRRSVWVREYRDLPPAAKRVWAAVRKDPRVHAPGWHNIFRRMRRSGLSWQSSYRGFFRKGLKVHLRYRKQIHKILRKSKVPTQLAALPFVESMYNPHVRSFVGALGLWQIMPMTGKELSLYVPPKRRRGFLPPIDERLDPLYATHAAARFIRLCRYYFKKNWPLAITSYNQGPGRILKLARRHRSRYLPHLIRRASKRRFGYDGRNFYAKFMASALILHRTKSFFPKARTKPLHFVKIRLKHPIWVKNLRKVVKLPVSGILLFNPMLVRLLKRRRHPIPAHFPLRLPAGAAKRLQKEARRLAQKGGATLPIKARRGDSVYKIARRFGVPLLVVRDHNKKLLKVSPRCGELNEQRLVWRRWRSKRRRARRRGKRLKRPDGVRRLSRKERRFYARKCRSRRALYRRLPKATVVKIPAYMRASTKPIEIYRVRGSEPLSWIACRACTTVWHLRSLNPSVPIKRLRAGTNLRVPQCPWSRRRLFTACHVHHYSRSRARRSRRSRSRRSRRKRRRRRQANN